jgi:transposase
MRKVPQQVRHMVVPRGHLLSLRSVRLKRPMILNVFGVYDNANNQILTHGYKKHKTSNSSWILLNELTESMMTMMKQIFLVLANATIHKSKIVKEILFRNIHEYLVFLPTRTPELNLIELRWLWLHRRQAINNSTFEDEQEIGKAVFDWIRYYNKKHIQSKHKVYRKKASMCLHDLNPIRITSICILLVQTLSESPQSTIYLSSKPCQNLIHTKFMRVCSTNFMEKSLFYLYVKFYIKNCNKFGKKNSE